MNPKSKQRLVSDGIFSSPRDYQRHGYANCAVTQNPVFRELPAATCPRSRLFVQADKVSPQTGSQLPSISTAQLNTFLRSHAHSTVTPRPMRIT